MAARNLHFRRARGLSGTFGFENNELHRKIYVNDPKNNLLPVLQAIFGTNPGDSVLSFPTAVRIILRVVGSFRDGGPRRPGRHGRLD